jgi:hypothetical protein
MNREIATGAASIYPLTGDVQSQAGNKNVEVVGIISIPITKSTPFDGAVLEYNAATNAWVLSEIATHTHAEPLTDGNANFIFAATLTTGGDIIVVIGVPD